jgi:hypothetical protein
MEIRILVVAMTNAHVANVVESRAMEVSAQPMTIVYPVNAGIVSFAWVATGDVEHNSLGMLNQ